MGICTDLMIITIMMRPAQHIPVYVKGNAYCSWEGVGSDLTRRFSAHELLWPSISKVSHSRIFQINRGPTEAIHTFVLIRVCRDMYGWSTSINTKKSLSRSCSWIGTAESSNGQR